MGLAIAQSRAQLLRREIQVLHEFESMDRFTGARCTIPLEDGTHEKALCAISRRVRSWKD